MNNNTFSWERARVENTYARHDRGCESDRLRIDAVYGKGAFRRKKVYLDKQSGERRTTIEIYGI